ncbi:MAG: hypothetical protein ACOY0T_41175 [Myxococcota bacterium]
MNRSILVCGVRDAVTSLKLGHVSVGIGVRRVGRGHGGGARTGVEV